MKIVMKTAFRVLYKTVSEERYSGEEAFINFTEIYRQFKVGMFVGR